MNRTTNMTRWHLLTTVSAMALLGSLCGAAADDADRPVLWIEAGGQLERLEAKQEAFAPPFVAILETNPFTPPASLQQLPPYAMDEDGKMSFQPEDSSWIFTASIRYGRSNGGNKHAHQETTPASPWELVSVPAWGFYVHGHAPALAKRFADTQAQETEKHAIIDFQAGKDIGLGLAANGTSTLSAGVRFVQFTSRNSAGITANPDFAVTYKYVSHFIYPSGRASFPQQQWHLYAAQEQLQRSFRGAGPIVSWDASMPLAGNPQSEDLTFDWGLNAALLFGRQKVHGSHGTNAHFNSIHHFSGSLPLVYEHQYPVDRSQSVTVPDAGGFAGLSLRFPDAKVSIGYRADLFFNAVDGGVDTRKSENRAFYGPFASISIGVDGLSN